MSVKILLAEDHDLVRLGFKAILAGEESLDVVAEAKDGEECVTLISEMKPDILLLDLSLPKLSGMAIVAKLKKQKSKIKIVILTAAEAPIVWRELLLLGVKGIVLKSVSQSELIAGLLKVSEGEMFIHSEVAALLQSSETVADHEVGNPSLDNTAESSKAKLVKLSVREKQVIKLVAEGYKTKDIADMLEISDRTVSKHRENIMTKLGMAASAELVNYANHTGLLKVSLSEIQ